MVMVLAAAPLALPLADVCLRRDPGHHRALRSVNRLHVEHRRDPRPARDVFPAPALYGLAHRAARRSVIVSLESDPRHFLGSALVPLSMFFFYVPAHLHAHRPVHNRREEFPLFFMFRPRPAHHATAPLRRPVSRLARPQSNPPRVDRAPLRGVTVFADRPEQPDASTPQKQRRHFPPTRRACVPASQLHVSPSHTPSRRLQRVSVVCMLVSRGQASRRRPTRARVSARAALRASHIVQSNHWLSPSQGWVSIPERRGKITR